MMRRCVTFVSFSECSARRLVISFLFYLNPDVMHIQYPTVGLGRTLDPRALALSQPSVVTTLARALKVY